MPRIIAAVIVSLLAGFAVGAWLSSDDAAAPATTSSGPALLGSDASVEEVVQRTSPNYYNIANSIELRFLRSLRWQFSR